MKLAKIPTKWMLAQNLCCFLYFPNISCHFNYPCVFFSYIYFWFYLAAESKGKISSNGSLNSSRRLILDSPLGYCSPTCKRSLLVLRKKVVGFGETTLKLLEWWSCENTKFRLSISIRLIFEILPARLNNPKHIISPGKTHLKYSKNFSKRI